MIDDRDSYRPDKRAISPISDLSETDIENLISGKTNLIDGILVFREFMKEYTSLGLQQKRVISMMHYYR